jgi:phosphomannomutase
MIHIFDVDGTLTPSRCAMDEEFGYWFLDFCQNNPVFLVTGSDKPKTVEQVGEEIYNACARVYNCSGNEVWIGDKRIYSTDWVLPKNAASWLSHEVTSSDYKYRTGNHIEARTGMVNFSVVGRNADAEQRAMYVAYDTFQNERANIAQRFEATFPDLSAKVGGDTGIDIFPVGCDKSQVLDDFDIDEISYINFYGDKCDEGGNDYPLAVLLDSKQVYHVQDWKHTWEILKGQ